MLCVKRKKQSAVSHPLSAKPNCSSEVVLAEADR
jgi:hypothetical protein